MSIIRRKRRDGFTIVPNHILEDDRLSFEARGVLCYLLTRPDDWTVRVDNLQSVTGYGRDKCRRMITEIIESGYGKREPVIDQKTGRFEGQELVIYDESYADNPEPENQSPAPENPAPGYPSHGKPVPIIRTENKQELISSSRKGTRIPDDWQPSQADIEFARDEGFGGIAISREAARFKDYWTAQPGQKGVKLDWPATWRNWVRNSADRQKPAQKPDRHFNQDVLEAFADLAQESRQ